MSCVTYKTNSDWLLYNGVVNPLKLHSLTVYVANGTMDVPLKAGTCINKLVFVNTTVGPVRH